MVVESSEDNEVLRWPHLWCANRRKALYQHRDWHTTTTHLPGGIGPV